MAFTEKGVSDPMREQALDRIRAYAVEALRYTEDGAEARLMLSYLGLEATSLLTEDVPLENIESPKRLFLVAPGKTSIGELELEVAWPLRIEYDLDLTRSEERVRIKSSCVGSGAGISADIPVSLLGGETPSSVPEKPLSQLNEEIQNLRRLTPTEPEKLHEQLPPIRAAKKRAQEKKEQFEKRARNILEQIRAVLLAWVVVGLTGLEGEEPAITSAKDRAFASDISHLWTESCKRRWEDPDLTAMGEPLDIPPSVSESAKFAVDALHRELVSIDEAILPCQAQTTACEIIEDRVAQGTFDFEPEETAVEVFAGKSRSEGSNVQVDEDVKNWVHDTYWHFRSRIGSEEAKDEVVSIAATHDFHFSRKSVVRWAGVE